MNYLIILSPDAEAGISSAFRWYHHANPDAAFRFLLKTDTTINRIRQYPNSFTRVSGVIRRAVLHRFPYSIFCVLMKEFVDCYGYTTSASVRYSPIGWWQSRPIMGLE